MKRILFIYFVLLAGLSATAQEKTNPLLPATRNISSEQLLGYVGELASDRYQGRLCGSEGYRLAAEWLADRMKEWGIEPAMPDGTWFQKFKQPWVDVLPGCYLTLHIPASGSDTIDRPYHYYNEFMPGSTSGSGTLRAGVFFAGYGISAPELGYDDYAGVDVRGKIVLIRPEAPVSPSVGADKFGPWLTYSTHQYKMRNAIRHGVAGILYQYGPLANTNCDYHPGLLLTMISPAVAEDLFKGTGYHYDEVVKQIIGELRPHSFDTGKTVTIHNETVYHPDGVGMNVIGMIPGTDPVLKNEVVMIDHCGRDWEVCPGANDNASGIAAMMGVARAIATSGKKFARTIVFMGIGAEEQGLVGSQTYAAHPVFPVGKTIGFINMDCVGVGGDLHAAGGDNYPDLFKAIRDANDQYVHRNLSSSRSENLGRPRSDAVVMMQAGIPTVSFSSSGGSGAYHTPGDVPATIWPETIEDLSTMLTLALANLAKAY
jgi:hypothetical protein